MLYYIYRLMRESRSLNVFIGILVFVITWLFVSRIMQMKLLGSILDKLVSVGVIVLIVLFQDEIRKFLYNLGAHQRVKAIKRFFNKKELDKEAGRREAMITVIPIVMAVINMSKGKVGALIIVEREMSLDDIVATGDNIDANVNQQLIENIFFKNAPLHDGAMIVKGKRIRAAGCILPVSHDLSIPKELGLRHRAAMGISQETDALAIVVSEETGGISVAIKGEFKLHMTAEELEIFLTDELLELT
jgi:uncharacterized protein (TIGR00159 family)